MMRTRRFRTAFILLMGLMLTLGMSGSAFASWGGTVIYSPLQGTIGSPATYVDGVYWAQASTTTHFSITVLDPSTNDVLFATPILAQSEPPGSTYGSYAIPAEDLLYLPSWTASQLAVTTWRYGSSGWELVGTDSTYVVF